VNGSGTLIRSMKHEALAVILPKVDEKALKSSFTKAIEAGRSRLSVTVVRFGSGFPLQ